ncbi:MAG: LacI family DNA-binding transcriptional regulator [Armatimonadota bacterium]
MPTTSRLVTIQDIADELSVSKMTVSAVLSGKASRLRISTSTQERVRNAANRLGYRPNEVARALRRKSTKILGFATGHKGLTTSDPWVAQILSGLQDGCREVGHDLLLHCHADDTTVENAYDAVLDGRVDGIIYYGPPGHPMTERIREQRLPVVAIVDEVPGLPCVAADDTSGGRLIAEHLFERGHTRLLYAPQLMDSSSVLNREAAVIARADELGLHISNWGKVTSGSEQAFLTRWLNVPPDTRPTAIVAWDDETAIRIWRSALKLGIRVPSDLAITGFDGIPTQLEGICDLSTIAVPWGDVARQGIHALRTILTSGSPPDQTQIRLPVALRAGDTT